VEQISAGDLEKFCYCPLSWRLSGGQDANEATRRGVEEHGSLGNDLNEMAKQERRVRHSGRAVIFISAAATAIALSGMALLSFEDVAISRMLGALALLWVLLATLMMFRSARETRDRAKQFGERACAALAIMAMVAALNSASFFGLSGRDAMTLEAVALCMLMAACILLQVTLSSHGRADGLRRKRNVSGRLDYVGEGAELPEVLRSSEHGLSGRPDYVTVTEDGLTVPVEVKTGRVPRGPLFSHVLQVGAYCLILEDMGRKVDHGVLKYGEQEHVIDFDENLRELLLIKLEEMREAMRTGVVARSHDRPGKCRSCSRRERCPERLC